MPAEDTSSDDQTRHDREQEPHRKPSIPGLVPTVTFGLGAAALAGVVVATGPVTPQGTTAPASAASTQASNSTGPDLAINHITETNITCTGGS